ncbi:AMP-binding enzyme [Oesophagostomum dentatum]|uniref:AMP-binding enzyme n=1 Tax=Oesophagostomum dentatum TaxID=61180 RepID=A0A0B1T3S0_OESDE|nr:AMP-binding enzyme [Oesophagostomum dentatum]
MRAVSVNYTRSADDMALLPYSSGTTGSPKGVILTHKNFSTMLSIIDRHFNDYVVGKLGDSDWDYHDENVLLMLPFYHIYGFGLMNQTLINGSTGIIFAKFEPITFFNAIQTYKPKMLLLVPPILLLLAKHSMAANYDLSSVQFVLTGAAPAGKDLCDEFLSKYKNVRYLAQAYGMTECGMASHLPPLDSRTNFTNVGKLIATFQQKIISTSTGEEVPDGERGEICVRSPTIMKGYLNRAEATAETVDSEGWLHTGDIGFVDEKGQTYIVDRLKELIKVKGLQVAPAELEDILLSHKEIQDAAVIGVPDEKTGERPRAYVVRANNSLTEAEVKQFIEGSFYDIDANKKRLRHIEV